MTVQKKIIHAWINLKSSKNAQKLYEAEAQDKLERLVGNISEAEKIREDEKEDIEDTM